MTTPTSPAPVTRIEYAQQSCGRCGGSGHYSYNSLHGTVCFGCKGRKRVLTPAARKSAAKITAFIEEHFSVPVEALVAGDRIKYDGYTRTVASVVVGEGHRYGTTVDGVTTWRDGYTVTFTKPIPTAYGPLSSIGTGAGATYVRAVTGADWQRVVEFASTLKGVTLVSREA